MATMIEKQMARATKDVEKYTKAVARYTALLEKKTAKCNELNCNWTWEQWIEHREANTYTTDQYMAWSKMGMERDHLEEAEKKLAYAEKELAKLTGEANAKAEENAQEERLNKMENAWWAMTAEERKAEYEAWLKEFKAECAKDGVIIDKADSQCIKGTTAYGKRFGMWINSGYTERSRHCYTLYIEGQTIFTSGDFSTGYAYITK